MKKQLIPLIYFLVFSAASPAYTQTASTQMPRLTSDPTPGMKHMRISPDDHQKDASPEEKEEALEQNEDLDEEEAAKEAIKDALAKPLIEKQKKRAEEKAAAEREKNYFSPQDKLKEWTHLRDLLSSDQSRQSSAIAALEKAPQEAPPMVLLLASDFLLKQGERDKAALYFFASKLRSEFDMKRWPAKPYHDGFKTRQKSHPARNIASLSQSLSKDLSGWIFAKRSRAHSILEKLQQWEETTPYAYMPTYSLDETNTEAQDFSTWKELHKDHLEAFIDQQNSILSTLHPK